MNKYIVVVAVVSVLLALAQNAFCRQDKRQLPPAYNEDFCQEQIIDYVYGDIGAKDVSCDCAWECMDVIKEFGIQFQKTMACFLLLTNTSCTQEEDKKELYEELASVIGKTAEKYVKPTIPRQ